jgi:hypothetical protein
LGVEKILCGACSAIEEIKRVTFMDLAKKRRQLRYEVKNALKLTEDDNIESVVDRAGRFGMFDAEDFEIQVDRWLSVDDKVFSHLCQTLNLWTDVVLFFFFIFFF